MSKIHLKISIFPEESPKRSETLEVSINDQTNNANLQNTRGFGSIFSNNSDLSNAITLWENLGCEGRCSKPD